MAEEIPLSCSLTEEELRIREATLMAQFKSAVRSIEELPDGYAFHLPGENKCLAIVSDLIELERECCPFLKFELTAEPKMGALVLRITGPAGTKEFLKIFSRES